MSAPSEPETPGFGYDIISPTPSPVMDVFTSFNFASPAPVHSDIPDPGRHVATGMEDDGIYHQAYNAYDSSFSTLKGWAGDMTFKRPSPRVVGDLSFVNPFANDPAIADAVAGDYGWPQAIYHEPYRSAAEIQHLQHYSTGLDPFNINNAVGVA